MLDGLESDAEGDCRKIRLKAREAKQQSGRDTMHISSPASRELFVIKVSILIY